MPGASLRVTTRGPHPVGKRLTIGPCGRILRPLGPSGERASYVRPLWTAEPFHPAPHGGATARDLRALDRGRGGERLLADFRAIQQWENCPIVRVTGGEGRSPIIQSWIPVENAGEERASKTTIQPGPGPGPAASRIFRALQYADQQQLAKNE